MQSASVGDSRSYAVIGAAMEVHRVMGCGYLEASFREALSIEFGLRQIPFRAEVPCPVEYKGRRLGGACRLDFVCFDTLVVEVKGKAAIGPADHAQVISYLAASGHSNGLLLNFGTARLEFRRFILTQPR